MTESTDDTLEVEFPCCQRRRRVYVFAGENDLWYCSLCDRHWRVTVRKEPAIVYTVDWETPDWETPDVVSDTD